MSSNAIQSFFGAARDKHLPRSTYTTLPEQAIPVHDWEAPKPNVKAELLSRYSRLSHWTRIAAAASNIISSILSIAIEAIMIYVTYKFYKTRHIPTPSQSWGPWPRNPVLWPTFMLASAAIITLLVALAHLIAACCRAKHQVTFFSVLYTLINVLAWGVVAALYRIFKTDKDLWGWSCLDTAKEIQHELGSQVLDFNLLCKIQVRQPSAPKA